MVVRPTVMEVDINNFLYNIEKIKEYVNGTMIMPIIKANGYGTHINFCTDVINSFDIVGVALVDEGIVLRNNGYKNDIFVLNQPYVEEIDNIIDNNIVVGISDFSFLEELGKRNDKLRVHIEIETGMGRTGINPKDIDLFLALIKKYSNVEVEGIYTHLSSADYDSEYTKKQLDIFRDSVCKIENIIGKVKYIHCSASNGILNYPDSYYNLVRSGIIMYGYQSFDKTFDKIDLKPVCKLKSKITFLKEVDEGTSIGYSRKFITTRKTKIATIPIGYADGIRRCYKGDVVVLGKRCPIVGNICMDSLMVDVTELDNVKVGEDVFIWDNDIITVEEIGEKTNQINYEVISTVSDRVPRIFIK